jgi:hypothetical protein
MITFQKLIDLGFEFEVDLDSPVQVEISCHWKRVRDLKNIENWKDIDRWLKSLDCQKYLLPRLWMPITSRPKKGQLDIFSA